RRHGLCGGSDAQEELWPLRPRLAVTREPRELVCLGDVRERREPVGCDRPRSTHISIESAIGCGYLDIERFSRALEHFSDRPSGTHGASQSGRENGAIVDRDNVVRARGCETDLQKIMGPTPRMKYRTAPTRAVRVNQVCD